MANIEGVSRSILYNVWGFGLSLGFIGFGQLPMLPFGEPMQAPVTPQHMLTGLAGTTGEMVSCATGTHDTDVKQWTRLKHHGFQPTAFNSRRGLQASLQLQLLPDGLQRVVAVLTSRHHSCKGA